jgi:hypothetical protein
MKPWAYSYFPPGSQGFVSQERTTRLPQLGLWACSYCREGCRDLIFPPGRQYSGAIHLYQPWKQMLRGKTLDEMGKRKMMRRRKKLMSKLGFLPLPKHALFISTP